MIKSITQLISSGFSGGIMIGTSSGSSGGARRIPVHSIPVLFFLIMCILVLTPGWVRAQVAATSTFQYTEEDGKVTITGMLDEDKGVVSAINIPAKIDGKPVVAIAPKAFYGNKLLTRVEFEGEFDLDDKTIYYYLESIGESAFAYSGITRLPVVPSLKTIGKQAFYYCKSLTNVVYYAYGSELETICDGAFGYTALTKIELPSSVKTVEQNAFSGCSSLASVIYDGVSNLQAIGNNAFSRTAIESIAIPSTVTKIGSSAFNNCKSLATVTFAEDGVLETIGNGAFGYTALTKLEVPSSVTTIEASAFNNCKSLASVTLAENGKLQTIGNLAFSGTAIPGISIPATVTAIGTGAFKNCQSFNSVTFSEGCVLRTIGESAFSGTVIPGIAIPATVDSIGASAFKNCQSLTSVIFSEGSMLRTIGSSAFVGTAMHSINLPSTVKMIGASAFAGLSFSSLRIPASVKTIASLAFANNQSLANVTLEGEETQVAANAFLGDEALRYIAARHEAAYDYYLAQAFEGCDKLALYPQAKLELTDLCEFNGVTRPTYYEQDWLQYHRSVDKAGQYATLCLPFDLDLSQTQGTFDKVYKPTNTLIRNLKESTDDLDYFILMLKEQEPDATIPAGQPIFVRLSETVSEISVKNTTVQLLTADVQPKAEAMDVMDWDGASGLMTQCKDFDISYAGTFLPQEASEEKNLWTFNGDGSFGWQKEGTVHPFRLVLNVEDKKVATQAKQRVISIGVSDGSTTGVREILSSGANKGASSSSSSVHSGIVYDLNGRKVATADRAKSLPKGVYVLNGKKMVIDK